MPDALTTVMMLKFLPLTALALGLTGGVALADRGGDHRGGWERHSPQRNVEVRDRHEWRGGDRGGDRGGFVREHRGWDGGGRVFVRGEGRFNSFERRPIFVSRPVIRERYYNYYRRPSLIVENYDSRPGYYWVAGRWNWDGSEWCWQPGHYQPDPNYVGQGYDPGYGQGYDGY
jgi:hypothetical protein